MHLFIDIVSSLHQFYWFLFAICLTFIYPDLVKTSKQENSKKKWLTYILSMFILFKIIPDITRNIVSNQVTTGTCFTQQKHWSGKNGTVKQGKVLDNLLNGEFTVVLDDSTIKDYSFTDSIKHNRIKLVNCHKDL